MNNKIFNPYCSKFITFTFLGILSTLTIMTWKEWHQQQLNTSLYIAVHSGNTKQAIVALDSGASIDANSPDEKPEFWLRLIDFVTHPNQKHNKNDPSLIQIACTKHLSQIVEVLLEKGADPNSTFSTGDTVLITAVRYEDYKCVKSLLSHHADVNKSGQWGYTPLSLAVLDGNFDMVNLIMVFKPKINTRDFDGNTPIFNAATNGNVNVVRLLLQNGADVQCRNMEKETARDWALKCGNNNIANILR